MSFEYQATKPKDMTKIDSRHMGELMWWSYNFGVTLEKLLIVVEKVGESAVSVRHYLTEHK